ncbi:MAG: SH3 domain-containing protein [Adhaeribacter sp.]
MKKLFFILALLVQTLVVSAATPDFKPKVSVSRITGENVKLYRQPGTSAEVLLSLKSSDEVEVIRQHNNYWSLVKVSGKAGYVLTSELSEPRKVKKNNRN